MDDDKFDEIAVALNKIATVQVATYTRVARLQAHIWVLESALKGVLVNQGLQPEAVKAKFADYLKEADETALSAARDFLAKHDIAAPPAGDPWWDKPSS